MTTTPISPERLREIAALCEVKPRRTRDQLVKLIGENATDNYLSFPDDRLDEARTAALAAIPELLAEIARLQSELTEATDHGDVWRERAHQMASRAGSLETALREACNWIADRSPDGSMLVDRLRAVADAVESRTI